MLTANKCTGNLSNHTALSPVTRFILLKYRYLQVNRVAAGMG